MLLMIVIFLLMFTVIVVAHEWGHYITAKKCGVLVHEFSVGMGPMLWSKQAGETLYSVRLFPIGGFCRMEEEVGDSNNPRAMASKKPWQKLLIVAAGAIMNFILAWLLCTILVGYSGIGTNVIQNVEAGSPVAEAGIVPGDKIVAIDNVKIKDIRDAHEVLTNEVRTYQFTVIHQGENKSFSVTSRLLGDETSPRFGFSFKVNHFNLWENIKGGFIYMIAMIAMVWEGLIQLITGAVGMDQMAGIVGVVDVGSQAWNTSMEIGGIQMAVMTMIRLAALLSANLGVMNLLPFPALDGGRIFFVLIEMIRGKAIPAEKEGAVHFIGMVLLMLLTVVVLYNDIMRLRG